MDYDSAGCLNLDSNIKREFLPVTLKALLFSGILLRVKVDIY